MRNSTYEQPLNERMRSFLRLEHLFRLSDTTINGTSSWDNRATLNTLFEIHNLLGRSDLKTEILKELDRHINNLTQLMENPNVDHQRLDHVLLALDSLSSKIFSNNNPFGHELKQNEFLNAIRQRVNVPGGTCEMDLPLFHHWLQQPDEIRTQALNQWFSGFENLRQAVELVLRLIRDSAIPKKQMAETGFYQRNLDSANPCQILRIALPADASYYPEISAGKHRFTIRFMNQESQLDRPKQIKQDIEFELACCMI